MDDRQGRSLSIRSNAISAPPQNMGEVMQVVDTRYPHRKVRSTSSSPVTPCRRRSS
jgi:hypothetical protein